VKCQLKTDIAYDSLSHVFLKVVFEKN
jgi:hypothetical protein